MKSSNPAKDLFDTLDIMGTTIFIVFLVLKLTGAITFDWFWVWFPLWIVPATEIGLCILLGILAAILDD